MIDFYVGGVKTATTSAVFGGVILALIEGVGIMIQRMTADQYKPIKPADPPLPPPPPAPVQNQRAPQQAQKSEGSFISDSQISMQSWGGAVAAAED